MVLSLEVQSSYDILFENNTPYSLYLNTGSLENLPDNMHGGWHFKIIQPYERAKVQWFNFDEGVKYGHRYTFFVEARRYLQDARPAIRFETTIKGFLVGSSIAETNVTSGDQSYPLFKKEPNPFYSKLMSQVLYNSPFNSQKPLTVSADAIKYTVPNPHGNVQLTDAISYAVTERQAQFHHNDNANELAVLTYNTQIWPLYGQVGGIIMNNPARRTEDIAERVNDYDIVTVQEFFEKDYRARFSQFLQAYLPYHVGPVSDMRPLNSGVVIYSRWPIAKEESMTYKQCAGLDCGASKGVSYALIYKYGVPYHIFSTHLQAGSEPDGSFNRHDAEVRKKQLEALHLFIEKQDIPADEAVIVTGDLNIDASRCYESNRCDKFNDILSILDTHYYQHDNRSIIPYSDDPSKNWMNTGHEKGAVEDYILVLNHHRQLKSYHSRILVLRAENDPKMYVGKPYGDTDLSDHFPVEAKLVFEGNESR